MRISRLIDTVGSALALQLLFVLTALPLITALPAALALQNEWERFRLGERTTVASFFAAFAAAWRARWLPGVLAPVFCAMLFVTYTFWAAVPGWPGVLAMGLLAGLAFVALCCWLSILATATAAQMRGDGLLPWMRNASGELLMRFPRYLLGLAVMITWFCALRFSFPLALVGSGILPALLAHWAANPKTAMTAD